MISSTMNISTPEHFWEPLRERLVHNLGLSPSAAMTGQEDDSVQTSLPLVVYISRQTGRRSLSDAAHADLLRALKKLEDEGICRFHLSKMESLSFQEQIELANRATVSC